jgi:crossover junction endodeoxyribonuclease RuvC
MIYIGIDPGITGAVVAVHEDGDVKFFDTPCIELKKSGKGYKTDFLPAGMADILGMYKGARPDECHAFIEQVSSMPGQGVASTFGFGKGYGIWIGILAAYGIPYTFVTPQRWKKTFMLGKTDKDASRLRAMELFPSASPQLARKKDIGRADALLIAAYGRMTLTQTERGKTDGKDETGTGGMDTPKGVSCEEVSEEV